MFRLVGRVISGAKLCTSKLASEHSSENVINNSVLIVT